MGIDEEYKKAVKKLKEEEKLRKYIATVRRVAEGDETISKIMKNRIRLVIADPYKDYKEGKIEELEKLKDDEKQKIMTLADGCYIKVKRGHLYWSAPPSSYAEDALKGYELCLALGYRPETALKRLKKLVVAIEKEAENVIKRGGNTDQLVEVGERAIEIIEKYEKERK